MNIKIPNKKEFYEGIKEFEKHEKREPMYKVAIFLINYFWGKPTDMADGLGVLLLTWNQAFYRYGRFDFRRLEKCIDKNLRKLNHFRNRELVSLSDSDANEIKFLFNEFLNALKISTGKKKGRGSPVAVAKALHILAPNFFPLWDNKITQAYKLYYYKNPSEKYILFCEITKDIVIKVKDYIMNSNKSILKLIDEYNYAKYTQGWI